MEHIGYEEYRKTKYDNIYLIYHVLMDDLARNPEGFLYHISLAPATDGYVIPFGDKKYFDEFNDWMEIERDGDMLFIKTDLNKIPSDAPHYNSLCFWLRKRQV